MEGRVKQSLGAIVMVLGLLWLSSYVVLRALHHYLDTPYNQWQMWHDATIQLQFYPALGEFGLYLYVAGKSASVAFSCVVLWWQYFSIGHFRVWVSLICLILAP